MDKPRAKKSFGQNFLQDASVVRKIIAAADIQAGETVLEIGPGTGVLTSALVEAGAKVVAVEADHDLISGLQERFGGRITLVEGDILNPPRSFELTETYKLVANIPYNITSPILEKFLSHEPRPSRMVLMVQKEVADRISAKPPQMSLLSIVCQIYAEVTKVCNVPAGAFRPAPKVDSAVVKLDVRPLGPADPESVIALAKIGFSHPRKQLHGNLAASGRGTSAEIKAALETIGLNPQIRAEGLTVGDWISLEARLPR
jgi:16S rRNA (adenine1518-N6/adenine1519-N6)-dimethyltransferase